MKIVYFLDFPHCIGGSNKVLLTQAYIMSKKEHDVIIVIPDDENGHTLEYDKICKSYGLSTRISHFSITTCLEDVDIVSVFEHYDEILQLLKIENVDLIHSTQINITAEMASRELQIPHLMNIYQTDLEMFNIEWLDIYPHYHSADSELFSKRWKEGLDIISKCIRVAYEGKETKEIDKVDTLSTHILCIGILAERKNQLEIIKFILICIKRGIRVNLILLGDNNTPYGEECKKFVKENGLEKEIVFEGFISNVENYFMQADLMILASEVESFPGVIVESMANKVPILSTPVAGVPELLQNEYNAFLTTGFSAQNIFETFKHYLKYKYNGKIQNIIDHAYETYIQNNTYRIVGKQLEDYYNWILDNYDNRCEQIKIDYLKLIFRDFAKRHCLEEKKYSSKNNIWFLYHFELKMNLKKPTRIAIWGAGDWGKIALDWLEILNYKDRLIGFIDTYKKGEYFGYPILNTEKNLITSCDIILLAISNVSCCLEIMKNLDSYGKKRNEDYFLMLNGPNRI